MSYFLSIMLYYSTPGFGAIMVNHLGIPLLASNFKLYFPRSGIFDKQAFLNREELGVGRLDWNGSLRWVGWSLKLVTCHIQSFWTLWQTTSVNGWPPVWINWFQWNNFCFNILPDHVISVTRNRRKKRDKHILLDL